MMHKLKSCILSTLLEVLLSFNLFSVSLRHSIFVIVENILMTLNVLFLFT